MGEGPIELKRDCEVVRIPSGDVVSIPECLEVTIVQELGGSFTLETPYGLVRLAGKDADALGKEVPEEAVAQIVEGMSIKDQVWEQLKTCYDPEIAANIVDLGLIYECKVEELPENQGYIVTVKMTLTAPGCGMGTSIAADAKHKIESLPTIKDVQVDVVWDPPWNPSMMSDVAREKLGLN